MREQRWIKNVRTKLEFFLLAQFHAAEEDEESRLFNLKRCERGGESQGETSIR